jgi:hypothetical protein
LKTAREAKYGIFHKGMLSLEHNCLRKLIEDPETYKKLEGKCHIGMTGFLTEHFWANSWKDNEDLLNCLKGSLHVPLVCDLVEPVADVHVVDGKIPSEAVSLYQSIMLYAIKRCLWLCGDISSRFARRRYLVYRP